MSKGIRDSSIRLVEIEDIHIINPRYRNQKAFGRITENIIKVGLKRPITITRKKNKSEKRYVLVCGQGRLEAYLACGQSMIPARIIEVDEEEALIMSLVENLARRYHSPLDLLRGIEALLNEKYTAKQISLKTGLTTEYVKSIVKLIRMGEERLLSAVESGQIPIDIAVQIAISPGEEQQALQDAYENNLLRGKRFHIARKIIETRRNRGKAIVSESRKNRKSGKALSGRDVLKIYNKEADRKRSLIKKSEFVNSQFQFVVEALRTLLRDDEFVEILNTEKMTSLPKSISEVIEKRELAHE